MLNSMSHNPPRIASLTLVQLSDRVSEQGLCSGSGDAGDTKWFPDAERPTSEAGKARLAAHARRVCAPCPVRTECLVLALRQESRKHVQSHGIWGGTAPWERERMLRRIRRRANQPARTVETEIGAEVTRVVPV